MSILITGGAGFIGSTLADKLLSTGKKVIVIDNFDPYYNTALKENNIKHNLNNPSYKLFREDICDTPSIETIFETNKITAVVHLAALAGVRASFENPQRFFEVNVLGTESILNCIEKYKVKKLLFASSSSVYGNCTADKFKENEPNLVPISPYANTKYECEKIIEEFTRYTETQAVCLRLFTVFGPRQRPDLAIRKFIELIKCSKPIPFFGDGSAARDYTFVDDIIDGFISALSYEQTKFEIINLGSDTPVSLCEMAATIEQVLQKKAKIEFLPEQKGDVKKTHADISKAKRLLHYSPKTSFKSGIITLVNTLE